MGFAADKFILLEIDYPDRKPVPADVKAARKVLAEKYSIVAYPTLYFADAKGRPFAEAPMEMEVKAWEKVLKNADKQAADMKAKMKAAAAAKAEKKAKLLYAIYQSLPEGVADRFYPELGTQILANDAKDSTGYKSSLAKKKAMRGLEEKIDALYEEEKFDEMIAAVEAFIKKQKSTGDEKAELQMLKVNIHYEQGDLKGVISDLKTMIADDPKGKNVEEIKAMIAQVKEELAEKEAAAEKAKAVGK